MVVSAGAGLLLKSASPPPAISAECQRTLDACPVVVDARCPRVQAAFDRIVNCLLPLYHILAKAADSQTDGKPPCLVLKDGNSSPVAPMVHALFGAQTFYLVPPMPAVCESLLVSITRLNGSATEHRSPARSPYRLLHRHILTRQPQWFLSWNESSLPPLYSVLICRTSNRKFMPAVQATLIRRIGQQTGREVRLHTDELPWLKLVALYSRAFAVIGYHGAGLANAVFVPRSVLVLEITTHMREPCEDNGALSTFNASERTSNYSTASVQPWRVNREAVEPWSPLIRWVTYFVSLRQMLAVNRILCMRIPRGMRADMLLKKLHWVWLSDSDLSTLADLVRSHLPSPTEGQGLSIAADSSKRLHQWRDFTASPPPPYSYLVSGAWRPIYESVLSSLSPMR
ncbi:MAG: hypothetical protein SGPRY_007592 [Prymnesium sp.]